MNARNEWMRRMKERIKEEKGWMQGMNEWEGWKDE